MDEKELAEFEANTKMVKSHKVWIGPRFGKAGYGAAKIGDLRGLAHRLAYQHYNKGTIDNTRVVVQSCGDKACVSKQHLSQPTPPPRK